jgi:hypothetical protein
MFMTWLVVCSAVLYFPICFVGIQKVSVIFSSLKPKDLLNKSIENLKSVHYDCNLMEMVEIKKNSA